MPTTGWASFDPAGPAEELGGAVAVDAAVVGGQPVAGGAFRPCPGDGHRRAGERRRAVGPLVGGRAVGGHAVGPSRLRGRRGHPQDGRQQAPEDQRTQRHDRSDDVTKRDATTTHPSSPCLTSQRVCAGHTHKRRNVNRIQITFRGEPPSRSRRRHPEDTPIVNAVARTGRRPSRTDPPRAHPPRREPLDGRPRRRRPPGLYGPHRPGRAPGQGPPRPAGPHRRAGGRPC